MTHHDRFSQAVNAAAAQRAMPRKACEECGGSWWYRANRMWHEMSCSQNALNKSSHKRIQVQREDEEQDREAAALRDLHAHVLPSCPHGYESFWACPGCTDAADRHNESTAIVFDKYDEYDGEVS